MKDFQYLKNVVTLKIDPEQCTGCGMCTIVCPHDVFKMHNKKAVIKNIDSCMECGACAKNCRFGALYVRSGVGCATGIINGLLRNTEPSCGCSVNEKSNCCN